MHAMADMTLGSVGIYYDEFGHRAHAFEKRTKCNIIRDLMVEALTAYAETQSGIEIIRKRGNVLFGFNSEYVIKIKKLTGKLKACVGSTQTSMKFNCNVTDQGELFEGTETVKAYFGYIIPENSPLNPLIYIVANDEKGEPGVILELTPTPAKPVENLEIPDDTVAKPGRNIKIKQEKMDQNK